jgi:hypothetical protein
VSAVFGGLPQYSFGTPTGTLGSDAAVTPAFGKALAASLSLTQNQMLISIQDEVRNYLSA